MSASAWPFVLTTISYLFLGVWVITRRTDRVQRLYGFLCISTCLWQGIWAAIFLGMAGSTLVYTLRLFYTGIVFLPAILYHFITEFCRHERHRWTLKFLYGASVALCALVWWGDLFVAGLHQYEWGYAAEAGVLHPIFALLVLGVIVQVLRRLYTMDLSAMSDLKRRQTQFVRIAMLIYCGGALDMVSNYGYSVFPTSFLFSGLAVVLFGYATFRYEFLEIAVPRESEEERTRREAASREMDSMGMVAAFPLVTHGELMGYLLLGEKRSEEPYSKEDLLLLRIVANQAALAYQRVRYLEMAVHGARTEMLGEIAGGFAHEIKTPLANISLPAELTLMDIQDIEAGTRQWQDVMPDLKDRMKDIMHQAFKASEKIEAIRQFSKPGQVKLEAISLPKILQNSLGLLDHLLRKTNVKVRTHFPAVLPPLRGDAKQLEIVFVNLIKNAAEAMMLHTTPALSRELTLRGYEEGDWIVAIVKDSGPGIKRTDFGHLFEAYFTTKGSEGTGMGLFLSHQVIKAHGGSIDVKSEEGRGTEFIIRLPKQNGQEGIPKAA